MTERQEIQKVYLKKKKKNISAYIFGIIEYV